jgi:hypothetical protein
MSLGVCIPCHKPHIQYIQKCLESIENQTRHPDIVSISISDTDTIPDLPEYSFKVKITVNNIHHCQGKNRNIAASVIDTNILTFFDVDDIMHPQRLEIIMNSFEKGIDGFIHNNKKCSSIQYRKRNIKDIYWEETHSITYLDGFSTSKDYICGRVSSEYGEITNGHFTCKRSVWEKHPYPENYGIGEDSEYIYSIYNLGYKIGYCPDNLSYYIRDDFSIDDNLKNIDSYSKYTSSIRPSVFCNYNNTEIKNVIDYLLSEKSPPRKYPIFIVDHVHLFPYFNMKKILYNIEQMTREDIFNRNISRMKEEDIIEIWDYSITNYNILKNYGFSVLFVPFKLSIEKIIEYRNLQSINKQYDIAFCGQMGEYRERILNELKKKGKNVLILDGEYTKYRDVQIGLSKLLINIHYNTNYKVFEYIRCEPWLSSGFTVLTENSLDNDPRAISVPYENLVDKACEILSSIDKQSTFISNTVVFYCNDLEMRNPQHYDIYETDKDIFIYNMALNCKNKGYNVIIYTKTILTEYNGIIFKNIKSFDPSSEIFIFILFPPFTETFIPSLIKTQNIFICMDQYFNIENINLDRVSKIFFDSKIDYDKHKNLPITKCKFISNTFYINKEPIERSPFKILCTQPYNDDLFTLLCVFWSNIIKTIPSAQIIIVSDPSVLSPEYREYVKSIITQPGIIERGIISTEELKYEKKSSFIHINLSSNHEPLSSIEESIELGCIPILFDIYNKNLGIHINNLKSNKNIEKLLNIYLSLISTKECILDEYRSLLRSKLSTYNSNTLIEDIELYLDR